MVGDRNKGKAKAMNSNHALTVKIIADIFTTLAAANIDASVILDDSVKQDAYKDLRHAVLHFVYVNRG
jgi:hypothetical protein